MPLSERLRVSGRSIWKARWMVWEHTHGDGVVKSKSIRTQAVSIFDDHIPPYRARMICLELQDEFVPRALLGTLSSQLMTAPHVVPSEGARQIPCQEVVVQGGIRPKQPLGNLERPRPELDGFDCDRARAIEADDEAPVHPVLPRLLARELIHLVWIAGCN
jgi:hypothetical protein